MDLVKKWKKIARQDDLFDHMVPSDVRVLIKEIARLQEIEKKYKSCGGDKFYKELYWTED